MSEQYEPVIVGLLCNWCSYRAADLAGTARMHYAPNLRIMRVMCSARVDPQFVLKALSSGADGVMIAGCLLVLVLGLIEVGGVGELRSRLAAAAYFGQPMRRARRPVPSRRAMGQRAQSNAGRDDARRVHVSGRHRKRRYANQLRNDRIHATLRWGY